jgi:hypothetical protein
MEAYPSIYFNYSCTISEIRRIRLTICVKAKGEVELIMLNILPIPLIEYVKCNR